MKYIGKAGFAQLGFFLLLFFALLAPAAAQNRVNEREIVNILVKLNVKLDNFRYGLDHDAGGNSITRNDEIQVNNFLSDLKSDISSLQDKLFNRSATAEDIRLILDSAKTVNDYVSRLRLSNTTRNEWTESRKYIERLASEYKVSWNWTTGTNYPNQYPSNNIPASSTYNSGLSGTYRLDSARTQNVSDIAVRSVTTVDINNREQARLELEQKLMPPDTITVDLRGNEVTLSSSIGSPITFQANGAEKTETMADGSTVRMRAYLQNQSLTISTVGGKDDYTVTFTSVDNGNGLRVSRRVSSQYTPQGVSAESFYIKTDSASNTVNTASNSNYPPVYTPRQRTGQYVVPNGTILTGVLEKREISTRTSRDNEPFSLWIQSPNEFRGAVVEGYITGLSGSDKRLTFNFQSIRLTNGETYDFSAFLQSLSNEKGSRVKTDAEGSAAGKGKTDSGEMIKRGGIGAGIGAVIGAIAGGGQGAAIGAAIGAGAGAGSVYVTGEKSVELKPGSVFTLQSSSPIK